MKKSLGLKGIFFGTYLLISASGNVSATTYDLNFTSNSSCDNCNILTFSTTITSSATFSPITMFDGDVLNVQFQNVPIPVSNVNHGVYQTQLFGQFGAAGAVIEQSGFGPTVELACCYWARVEDGAFISSSWLISFNLLSGVPIGSAGLTFTGITAQETVTPLPATLPLFLTGLGAIAVLGRSRKRGLAEQQAHPQRGEPIAPI